MEVKRNIKTTKIQFEVTTEHESGTHLNFWKHLSNWLPQLELTLWRAERWVGVGVGGRRWWADAIVVPVQRSSISGTTWLECVYKVYRFTVCLTDVADVGSSEENLALCIKVQMFSLQSFTKRVASVPFILSFSTHVSSIMSPLWSSSSLPLPACSRCIKLLVGLSGLQHPPQPPSPIWFYYICVLLQPYQLKYLLTQFLFHKATAIYGPILAEAGDLDGGVWLFVMSHHRPDLQVSLSQSPVHPTFEGSRFNCV